MADYEDGIEQTFNKTVHVSDAHGDPERKEDGTIKLKTNWQDVAVDRQGRTYNEHVHGKKRELDTAGFLKVRRRKETSERDNKSLSRAFVAKYYEKGYAYYLANDIGGRVEQMTANDWEPVTDKDGPASMPVGQAREGNTNARLFRKPEEWYLADQEAKVDRNKARFEQTTSPNEDEGQYQAAESSPLR